jgi:hypothetical protein
MSDIPAVITEEVVQELRTFVLAMLSGYNNVPYHNVKHAYHVLLSSSTLMDTILQNSAPRNPEGISADSPTPFEQDGLMQLALLFSALIHDTEHQGVPNAQLVSENNPLAIQYNDQSVAEQRSLTVAFLELLQPAYDNLRKVMFPEPNSGEDYRRFRGAVTSLILATDIATPARGKEVRERWESVFKLDTGMPPSQNQKAPNALPLLSPPREHPTPSRRRRKVVVAMPVTGLPKLDRAETETSWIECAPTPSTHFPRSTAGSSMHDSMAFWWFSPEQLSQDDESSVKTFSEDDTSAAASPSNNEMTNASDQTGENNDLDASISLFSEHEKSTLDETSAFSDDFPHESKAFQFSCSTFSNDSSHHLLSSSRVFKPRRSFSSPYSGGSKGIRRVSDSSLGYCDMKSSDNDSIGSKPRTILHAFTACTPRRGRAEKAEILVEHFDKTAKKEQVGSESSLLSGGLTADLTYTDASSANGTLAPIGFDSFSNIEVSETNDNWEHESNAEDEEVLLKGEPHEEVLLKGDVEGVPLKGEVGRAAPTPAPDERSRSLSLIEHILLVADVSHTMQSWDTMNMFSLRLSKEIMKSIKKGRSGGIKEDPLDEWYSNQSGFLLGYIMPLAQRLEQTGVLPPADNGTTDGFLSSYIQRNLDRWQEQGHDIIAVWRREREQHSTKKASKKLKKKKDQKASKDVPSKTKKHSPKDPKVLPSKPKKTPESKKKKTKGAKTRTKGRRHDVVEAEASMIPATNTRPCTLTEELGGEIH